jgi:hypothetical protein
MRLLLILLALRAGGSIGAVGARTGAGATEPMPTGAGNQMAAQVAAASPLVRRAVGTLQARAVRIRDPHVRQATLDLLRPEGTCVVHRAGLTTEDELRIVSQLRDAGLYAQADVAAFPGGARAGVFPPVEQPGTACPRTPQPFSAAPGSNTGGHHSYPGGLAVHEAFNARMAAAYATQYRDAYGMSEIDDDVIAAAPLWHDWAKILVFQWNADGTEFAELSFGGAGTADDGGSPGDSRTPAHHILGLAEAIARGMPPELVIAQASAHAAPTLGNEFKVVNWLRAAAIMAQVDPVARGLLAPDTSSRLRLPALFTPGGDPDVHAATPPLPNILIEDTIHGLSDADFTFSIPAVSVSEFVLARLATEHKVGANDRARYNWEFRHCILSNVSAERLAVAYTRGGLGAVRKLIAPIVGR